MRIPRSTTTVVSSRSRLRVSIQHRRDERRRLLGEASVALQRPARNQPVRVEHEERIGRPGVLELRRSSRHAWPSVAMVRHQAARPFRRGRCVAAMLPMPASSAPPASRVDLRDAPPRRRVGRRPSCNRCISSDEREAVIGRQELGGTLRRLGGAADHARDHRSRHEHSPLTPHDGDTIAAHVLARVRDADRAELHGAGALAPDGASSREYRRAGAHRRVHVEAARDARDGAEPRPGVPTVDIPSRIAAAMFAIPGPRSRRDQLDCVAARLRAASRPSRACFTRLLAISVATSATRATSVLVEAECDREIGRRAARGADLARVHDARAVVDRSAPSRDRHFRSLAGSRLDVELARERAWRRRGRGRARRRWCSRPAEPARCRGYRVRDPRR